MKHNKNLKSCWTTMYIHTLFSISEFMLNEMYDKNASKDFNFKKTEKVFVCGKFWSVSLELFVEHILWKLRGVIHNTYRSTIKYTYTHTYLHIFIQEAVNVSFNALNQKDVQNFAFKIFLFKVTFFSN